MLAAHQDNDLAVSPSSRMTSAASRLVDEIEPIPVGTEHIADLAQLHQRELHWSLNGQLGPAHTLELYNAISESPYFFGYAYYRAGELIGFVTGTTNSEDTRGRIMDVYRRKLLATAWHLLRHPRFLLAALESKFIVPRVFRRLNIKAEWLTFVTDTRQAGLAPFVALRLIDAVQDHFSRAGVDGYAAQGYKINPKAMKLYAKLRWRVVQRLPMHAIYYYPTNPK